MLRPAGDVDLLPMRDWRNQEINRAVSNNTDEIGLDEHLSWWDAIQYDRSKQVLVFEYDGRPLGIVNFFDLAADGTSPRTGAWGFFLDNETVSAEGIAMTAWIQVMKDATAYAFDELGLDLLTGEVHEGNDAVRMMNKRFRFTEGEPETRADGRVFYPITLRREDRRQPKEKKQ